MLKRLILILAFLLVPLSAAKADCPVHDPYKMGQYANEILAFNPGFYIDRKGWGLYKTKRRLHPSRLIHPANKVLGCPKPNLEKSLTLGHGGHVVISANKCFRNGQGPDIIIHEPRSLINENETFNVYVTDDKKGIGPWYVVAKNLMVNANNNYLPLDLDHIKNQDGLPIHMFRWLKIEDANSQIVMSNQLYSGFDVSSVKFTYQCDVPMS